MASDTSRSRRTGNCSWSSGMADPFIDECSFGMKNILFLSYWSLREPLTASAIFPYLRILSEREDVRSIRFVSLETSIAFLPEVELDIPKVTHVGISPRARGLKLLSTAELNLRAIMRIRKMVRKEKIDLVIAQVAMAGAIAHFVKRSTGVPYIVQSYEPHSVYMAECGMWNRRGLRYRFAHYMEKLQLNSADYIVTVTKNGRDALVAAGSDADRVLCIPSITDLGVFAKDLEARAQKRKELGIADQSTLGIYVGKFGGLYFDEEAFTIFARAFQHFQDLHVLVLSPMDPKVILAKANKAGIPEDRFHVLVVRHTEVPQYLSAADFAFSTIKPSPIKRYQCPIKNGEYWANGLPILMTDGISDDYKLMRQGIGGSVYGPKLEGLDEAFRTIINILADKGHRQAMVGLAEKYRSVDIARRVYRDII